MILANRGVRKYIGTMKRFSAFLFTTALLLAAFTASAQSIPLLDKAVGHRVTFDYSYGYTSGGKTYDNVASGKMTVQGSAYLLKGDGLEVYSDGKVRWTLDRSGKEAIVESVDAEDVMTNPAAIVAGYKSFDKSLKVNSSGTDSLDISLTMENGQVSRFRLTGIRYAPEGALSDFQFARSSLGSDWVVTDLR